ncbi:CAAX prenyl protease 2-like [Dysidea avara]|uniref:CAAX prenyl protease 2-like n=1 Tax=Dysidea avara TaxID=196820 RepID=UPI00331E6D8C
MLQEPNETMQVMAPLISFDTLAVHEGVIACFILAVAFVGSLYLAPTNKPRDDPETIRWRMLLTGIVTISSPFYLLLWADRTTTEQGAELHHVLGIKTDGILTAIILPLLLTIVLYAGVIIHTLMAFASQSNSVLMHFNAYRLSFCLEICLRNYFVAPFVEEFVFRACMLPMLTASMGKWIGVLVCPLFFGVAHLHHLVEWYRWRQRPLVHALLITTVQFCYTSLFGLYSAFLFIRTGHLTSPVVSHMFCNFMGLPDIDTLIRSKYSMLLWTLYVCGLLGFLSLLVPLTDPSLYYL